MTEIDEPKLASAATLARASVGRAGAAAAPRRVALVGPAPAAVVQPEVAVARPAGRQRRGFELAVRGGIKWRSPDLVLGEVSGSLGWRGFVLGAGYQPAVSWSLEGRPLRVSAIPLSLGWHPTVWERRRLRVELALDVVLDRLSVQRQDLPGEEHSFWDVGVSGGAALSLHLGAGMRLALSGTFSVYFTGRELAIPEETTVHMNIVGFQPLLALGWAL